MFCKYNHANPLNLYTRSRERRIVETRRMIWGYLRDNTPMTFNELGTLFNRDHASTIHSVAKHRVSVSLSPKGAPYDLEYTEKYKGAVLEIKTLSEDILGRIIYRDYMLTYYCPTNDEYIAPVIKSTSLREAIEEYELYNPITDEELVIAKAL